MEDDRGRAAGFLWVMALLLVGAVAGQLLSLRALVGLNEEKTRWDVQAETRVRLAREVEDLEQSAAGARAATMTAKAEREQARKDLEIAKAARDSARAEVAAAQRSRDQANAEAAEYRATSVTLIAEIQEAEDRGRDLQAERERQQATLEMLEDEVGPLRATSESLKAQTEHLQRERSAVLEDIATTQDQLITAKRELADLESRLAEANALILKADEAKMLAAARDDVAASVTALEQRLGSLRTATTQAREERDKLLQELPPLREERRALETEAVRQDGLVTATQERLALLDSQEEALVGEIDKLEERRNTVRKSLEETAALKEEVDALTAQKAALNAAILDLQDRRVDESTRVARITAQAEELEDRVLSMQSTLAEVSSETNRIRSDRDALQSETSALQSRQEVLALQVAELEQRNSTLQGNVLTSIQKLADAVAEAVQKVNATTGTKSTGDDEAN